MASQSNSTNPPEAEPPECQKLRDAKAKCEEVIEAIDEIMDDLGCNSV